MKTPRLALTWVGCLIPLLALSQPLPLAGGPGLAQAPGLALTEQAPCQRLEFDVLPFAHTEDFTTSVASLGVVQVANKAHNSGESGWGLGLVRVERSVTVTFSRDEVGCRRFAARLGYINAVLFVGKELRSSPCAFEHVRSHEYHHVEMYAAFINTTVPMRLEQLREQLTAELASLGDAEASATLEKRLYALLREVKPQHDAFDSVDEYSRNAYVCGGVIRRIVKRI